MSFGLSVYAPAWPDDLAGVWRESLSRHGLLVEVFPGFSPARWKGGFLPFKLGVARASFSTADRYGDGAVLAGFEVDFQSESPADLEELATEAPPEVASVYRKSRHSAYLSTSMGKTVADLRLQCFAAATLAIASGGVVSDGQQGKDFVGEAAIQNAAREADEHEAHADNPRDWDLTPFPGWGSLEPPA
jgi:hypothetical protein